MSSRIAHLSVPCAAVAALIAIATAIASSLDIDRPAVDDAADGVDDDVDGVVAARACKQRQESDSRDNEMFHYD